MKDKPLVSVVIPTYNRINTLPTSINSVLNQTYDNLEIIVMDDGSEDGTEEYVKSIADKRVRYIKSSVNMGPSAARNKGAELAEGEYLAFQDSDDEWMPDKLEKQMELMLNDEGLALVYCEFGLYIEGELYKNRPSRELPYERKTGNLFSYLLLFPLISTQTIVVKKRDFMEERGFNESLKAYEDFEFTLRFSRKHMIGFVEESLVKVNSSPDSVNKRYAERIRTQFFMVREMLQEYRERGLLGKKLECIMDEAENLICHDIFIDELRHLMYELLSGEEQEEAGLLLQRIEQSKKAFLQKEMVRAKTEELGCKELNQGKWQIYNKLPYLKQRISTLYQEIADENIPYQNNIYKEVEGIRSALNSCSTLFEVPRQMRAKYDQIKENAVEGRAEAASVLIDMFEAVEELEVYIGEKAKRCNVCNNEVFFMPIPAGYEDMRKRCGFPYWNADFQLESKENYNCPVCGASDRDRLMIAFLEEVKAESNEKLRMLQIAPSRPIERYALEREDIAYESTDLMRPGVTFQADLQHMDMVENEAYDIIVCSHVLEHVENDMLAMKELYRMLKPDGVCLVLVPLIVGKTGTEEQWGCTVEENWRRFGQGDHSRLYGKGDFIERLQQAGFCVNELGKEWFGEEFYDTYGFDDLSIMYVATKGIKLVE